MTTHKQEVLPPQEEFYCPTRDTVCLLLGRGEAIRLLDDILKICATNLAPAKAVLCDAVQGPRRGQCTRSARRPCLKPSCGRRAQPHVCQARSTITGLPRQVREPLGKGDLVPQPDQIGLTRLVLKNFVGFPLDQFAICQVVVEHHIDRRVRRQAVSMEAVDRPIIIKDQVAEPPRVGLLDAQSLADMIVKEAQGVPSRRRAKIVGRDISFDILYPLFGAAQPRQIDIEREDLRGGDRLAVPRS